MSTVRPELDCTQTVRAIVHLHPETQNVFHRFGVDTCCGGGVSVEEAARREGVKVEELCAALGAAVTSRE